jgi:hypothetical protein
MARKRKYLPSVAPRKAERRHPRLRFELSRASCLCSHGLLLLLLLSPFCAHQPEPAKRGRILYGSGVLVGIQVDSLAAFTLSETGDNTLLSERDNTLFFCMCSRSGMYMALKN